MIVEQVGYTTALILVSACYLLSVEVQYIQTAWLNSDQAIQKKQYKGLVLHRTKIKDHQTQGLVIPSFRTVTRQFIMSSQMKRYIYCICKYFILLWGHSPIIVTLSSNKYLSIFSFIVRNHTAILKPLHGTRGYIYFFETYLVVFHIPGCFTCTWLCFTCTWLSFRTHF